MSRRVNLLAAFLKSRGIPVQSIEVSEDGDMDHELTINDDVSVQVSALEKPYVIVSALVDDGTAFQHWPDRTMTEPDLIEADIRAALALTATGAAS